jgi:Protein of unknown function (DUF3006)
MICDDRGMVSLKATIDRFEDGYAVLLVRGEEAVHIDFPVELLPEGCREGDILNIEICRDEDSTEATRKRVSGLIEKLKNKKYD